MPKKFVRPRFRHKTARNSASPPERPTRNDAVIPMRTEGLLEDKGLVDCSKKRFAECWQCGKCEMPFAPSFRNVQQEDSLIAHAYRTIFRASGIGGLFKMCFPGFLSRGARKRLFFRWCPHWDLVVPAVFSPSPLPRAHDVAVVSWLALVVLSRNSFCTPRTNALP
jgi:hypothetical protein